MWLHGLLSQSGLSPVGCKEEFYDRHALPILTVSVTPMSVSQAPHLSWMFRQHLTT